MLFPRKYNLILQLLTFLLICIACPLLGQEDSTITKILNIENDSIRIIELAKLVESYSTTDLDKAWELAHMHDSLTQAANNPLWVALTKHQYGNLYFIENNYELAIKQLTEAAQLYQDNDPENGKIERVFNTIATIYVERENFEKAIEYYQRALEIFRLKKDSLWIGITSLNASLPYIQLKELDKAESILLTADSIFNVDSRRVYRGYSCLNLADTYQEQQKYKKANQYAKLAMKYMPIERDPKIHSGGHLILGRTYQHERQYERAIKEFIKGLNIAKEVQYANHVLDASEGLWQSYESSGKDNLAFPHLKTYTSIKDSLSKEGEDKRMLEVLKKFEFEKQEADFAQLQLEDELNQQKLSQQKFTITGLGVGLFSLGLLLFGLFTQKNKIQKQNSIIATALSEKDTLLREIHHRVKNNLQVVSSLLGIQSRGIKDQKAKDAIQEGRNRVQSMSLIHQNLYKKDNLTGIEMEPYIDKLSNHLLETYQVEEGEVKIKTQVEDITLDVETVVPIGLIINELISNALKYAFPDNRNGTISINLSESKDQLLLSITDDGIGLNDDQLKTKAETFGHSLIRAFKKKLDAEIYITSDQGTSVALKIKKYRKVS